MFQPGPLRWLLIPGRPGSDIALYLPHAHHFAGVDLSTYCVRYISRRTILHTIDLLDMSTWDYLRLGMPDSCPDTGPFPPDQYFWEMTHNEDCILHGGPLMLDNIVISQGVLDEESIEEQTLLEDIEDLQDLIESGDASRDDKRLLRKYKLRVTRLTKKVWLDTDHDGSNCAVQ
jgi:hypothetical protein